MIPNLPQSTRAVGLALALALTVGAGAAQAAAPTLTGHASASVPVGGSLSSTVELAGTAPPASGTISFRLYGPADGTCSGIPLATASRTVTGDGTYTSSTVTARTAGTHRWVVSYSGDANNDPVAGSCADPDQSTVVTKTVPTVTAIAPEWVPLGGIIDATAQISGMYRFGGTIVLRAYRTADCSGPPFFSTGEGSVIGNGIYGIGSPFATSSGTYRWVLTYSGDANNEAAETACDAPGSVTEVDPNTPTLDLTAPASSQAGDPVALSAQLADGWQPTGSVSFAAYADTACTGAPVWSSGAVVSGNGAYEPDTAFTPTSAGSYRVVASYSGDDDNRPVAAACDGVAETVEVTSP